MIYSYRELFGAILQITNSTELGTLSDEVQKLLINLFLFLKFPHPQVKI